MSEANSSGIEEPRKVPERCIGPIIYNGVVYHGQGIPVEEAQKVGNPQLDLDVDYTSMYINTTLAKSHIWKKIGNLSLTLGPGYYTTTEKAEADRYAHYRTYLSDDIPVVDMLDLENARLYDFRDKSNLNNNAKVPFSLAKAWETYYNVHKNEIMVWAESKNSGEDLKERFLDDTVKYSRYLHLFIERLRTGTTKVNDSITDATGFYTFHLLGVNDRVERNLDLRDMLRTYIGDDDYASPLYGGLWARFVRDELLCDGIIVNEGGDEEEFVYAPIVALYKLSPEVIRGTSEEVLTKKSEDNVVQLS